MEREEAPREPVAGQWDTALAGLPADWSDLLCELQLTSTDHLARAALLTAPINPTRVPDRTAFRFRVARMFGYGASPEMTRRCLERLDAEDFRGRPRRSCTCSPTRTTSPRRAPSGAWPARRSRTWSGDPVSWLLIERGWTVYDAEGEKVGKVKEVLADEQADIFHGVLVDRGLLGPDEEVVADRIAEIHDGDLHLA